MEMGVILAILGIMATPVAITLTWLFNRTKANADIYEALSQSSLTAVNAMQASMDRMGTDLQRAINDLATAQDKIDMLLQDNSLLKAAIRVLESQNNQLIHENADLKAQIDVVAEGLSQMGSGSVILVK